MQASYYKLLDEIKTSIKKERLAVVVAANSSMIILYWKIGKMILEKQDKEGWGTKVIDRLSYDLKEEFQEMKGFSTRNLKYMRKFAECWTDFEFVQRVVAQIPWRSNITLMDKLDDIKSKLMKDEEFKEEYDKLSPRYEVISQIIEARKNMHITQEELARIAGTKKSNISRLESGSYNPSLDFLIKIAKSLGKDIHIEMR